MFKGMKGLQEQLASSIPDKKDQIRMVAIGAILNAKLSNGRSVDAADVVKEADIIAGNIVAELDKL